MGICVYNAVAVFYGLGPVLTAMLKSSVNIKCKAVCRDFMSLNPLFS